MARALVTQFICMYANTVAVMRLHVFKKTMIESIKFQSKRLKFKHMLKSCIFTPKPLRKKESLGPVSIYTAFV